MKWPKLRMECTHRVDLLLNISDTRRMMLNAAKTLLCQNFSFAFTVGYFAHRRYGRRPCWVSIFMWKMRKRSKKKKRGTQVHDESDKDYIQESDTKKRERDWGVREERKHGLLRQINNRVHARTFTKRRKRVTNKHTGTSLRATSFLKIDLWKR